MHGIAIFFTFGIFFACFFSVISMIGCIFCKPFRSVYLITYLGMISLWLFFAGCGAANLEEKIPFNIFNPPEAVAVPEL